MPGAGFKTFNAGEVFTATDANTYLMQQSLMVFTNEAARNTAISSPSEGMMCYLTAPTEPSATGMTITGIRQIYDGTAWTTVSPLSGLVTTTQAATSATFGDLATVGPTVTIRTGTSVIITLSTHADTSAANRGASMSFAVSGATTLAAADDNAVFLYSLDGDVYAAVSRTFLLGGLTAGVNTFTAKYKNQTGNVNFLRRSITVQGAA